MEQVLRPIYQERASQSNTLGVSLVGKREEKSNVTDTFDTVLLSIASVNASGLLNGIVITSSAVEVVTPAESGVPNVAGPEPAATNTKSK